MEGEAARRRISAIADHFIANEDISAAASIMPMNCSGSLNFAVRRCDNRMLFGRQSSCAQASFMRQASADQSIEAQQASQMKCSGSENSCNNFPLFSRPRRMEQSLPSVALVQPVAQGCNLMVPELPPKFARPNRRLGGQKELKTKKKVDPSRTNGVEWSPRMDVTESRRGYILTVELPGFNTKDIKVEVNEKNLIMMGIRSPQSWKVASFCDDLISSYHKREIIRGPYQVVWPLPNGINKAGISAEFLNGFLQVVVPKL